jgi:formylglycine-generating enzyme required for sulfatase activity
MKQGLKKLVFPAVCLLAALGMIFAGCSTGGGDDGNGGDDDGSAVVNVSLNKTVLSLVVGGSETLTVTITPADATNKNVSWSSSNSGVAAVSGGTVSALTAGTAIITVTTEDGAKTAACTITVVAPGQQDIRTLNGISVPFRFIPAGSFQRDSWAGDVSVITRSYWMGETEVTQELFEAVMGAGTKPSYFTSNPEDVGADGWKKLPVERVRWYAAIAFCNKLSLANGKDLVYSVDGINWNTLTYSAIPTASDSTWDAAIMDTTKNGYRLPTEMEWMWAAMGADTADPGQRNTAGYSKAFAGSTGSNNVDDYVWHSGNSGGKTHEVGKQEANELGLKDMSGNVYEWCWNWFDYSYPFGTLTDYTGATSSTYRVMRGGSWSNDKSYCTVASRFNVYPFDWDRILGFRVVSP